MAEESRQRQLRMKSGAVERLVDIPKMLAIVRKNWLVLKGDRIRLVPLLLFPIIMIVIFGYVAGNLPKHISAAVVDYDQSGFSRAVQDQISGTDLFAVRYLVGTKDEGKRLMDEGKINVLFILPSGMGQDMADGKPVQLMLMVDESDSSVAQVSKSSAQSLASSLSSQAAKMRLSAISQSAGAAKGELEAAESALPGRSAKIMQLADSSGEYYREAGYAFSSSNGLVEDSALALQNSLGYLIDQNEIVESFSPASMGSAALTALATGDSQQSVLQQIGIYGIIGARQAGIFSSTGKLFADSQELAGLASAQGGSEKVSIALMDSAQERLGRIDGLAGQVQNPVEIAILEPYGYGRRGIDFLLPSILALIIFQGATMGLGRAIAGERKDGSLTRVFLTPTSNVTIILGTQLFYLILETIRSSFIILVAIALFGVSISGSMIDIIAIIAIFALGATGVGMVLSVITHNQEQYMAVGMLISLPVMFLSGAFFPIQTMPPVLQSFAGVLPVTYAADALRGVMVKGFTLTQVMPDMAALAIFGAFTLTLSLLLFKREVV